MNGSKNENSMFVSCETTDQWTSYLQVFRNAVKEEKWASLHNNKGHNCCAPCLSSFLGMYKLSESCAYSVIYSTYLQTMDNTFRQSLNVILLFEICILQINTACIYCTVIKLWHWGFLFYLYCKMHPRKTKCLGIDRV